nr:hypothetical protein Iba_chr15eCG2650 [Ipomoea batatas]
MRNLFQMSKGEELGLSSRRCRRVRNWRPTVKERPVEVGDSVEHLVDDEAAALSNFALLEGATPSSLGVYWLFLSQTIIRKGAGDCFVWLKRLYDLAGDSVDSFLNAVLMSGSGSSSSFIRVRNLFLYRNDAVDSDIQKD